MYKVTSTTHFEDWYVGDMDRGYFKTIKEAMELLRQLIEAGFESDYSNIAECYHEDDPDFGDFNKGFIIFIYNSDDDIVVYQGFEYDHRSNSTEQRSEVIFNLELLTQEEIRVLLDLGYNLHNE